MDWTVWEPQFKAGKRASFVADMEQAKGLRIEFASKNFNFRRKFGPLTADLAPSKAKIGCYTNTELCLPC